MKYTVVLLADAEKGYTAVVPALPGCVSEGDSAEEALEMVAEAIALYLESAREHGEESPTELPGTLIGEVEIDHSGLRAEQIASSPQSRRP